MKNWITYTDVVFRLKIEGSPVTEYGGSYQRMFTELGIFDKVNVIPNRSTKYVDLQGIGVHPDRWYSFKSKYRKILLKTSDVRTQRRLA